MSTIAKTGTYIDIDVLSSTQVEQMNVCIKVASQAYNRFLGENELVEKALNVALKANLVVEEIKKLNLQVDYCCGLQPLITSYEKLKDNSVQITEHLIKERKMLIYSEGAFVAALVFYCAAIVNGNSVTTTQKVIGQFLKVLTALSATSCFYSFGRIWNLMNRADALRLECKAEIQKMNSQIKPLLLKKIQSE